MHAQPDPSVLGSRKLMVLTTTAVGVAAAGFLTGTSHVSEPRQAVTNASSASAANRALSYSELSEVRRGPNRTMYQDAFTALSRGLPGPADPVLQNEEDRQHALSVRASRRAYNGAPPTIPHAIDQRGMPSCLTCHERGAKVGQLTAPIMSHTLYANCIQCHVVSDAPRPLAISEWAGNAFENTGFAQKGQRAWSGAPPTIPHSTHMRENCSSCHGTAGALGLRTPHPDRQSCTQCHAPSADLDQRAQPHEH